MTALRLVAARIARTIRCIAIGYVAIQVIIWHSFYAADPWRLAAPVAVVLWGAAAVAYLRRRWPAWQLAVTDSGFHLALALGAMWSVPPAMRGDAANWLYIAMAGQLFIPAWFAPTAVFAPLIFFGGIVGRLFNEFALTLSVAVMISLVVSLTTTPMMCALILPRERVTNHGRLYRATEHVFDAMLSFYRTTLRIALKHPGAVFLSLLATIGLNYYMFRYQMTYGLFPVQDTGLIIGSIQADQSISFQSMQKKLLQLQTIVQDDPAVASVVGFTGGRQTNAGFVYISLKPFSERGVTADDVVTRLRGKLAEVAGARLFMVAVSDLRTGGRQSNATYQYTLLSDGTSDLYAWTPKLTAALMSSDIIKDVNSDQQQGGLETDITIDRDTAMRLGLTLNAIDNTLYDAFGQRQVSTI